MTYTKKVQDHFTAPHNVGELPNANSVGQAGNPVCGDVMEISLKVENGVIENAKFKTFGCAAAVATVDAVCDMVRGKTLKEAKKLTFPEVVEELGGLPKEKVHCSSLAITTLKNAIADYEKAQG